DLAGCPRYDGGAVHLALTWCAIGHNRIDAFTRRKSRWQRHGNGAATDGKSVVLLWNRIPPELITTCIDTQCADHVVVQFNLSRAIIHRLKEVVGNRKFSAAARRAERPRLLPRTRTPQGLAPIEYLNIANIL